MAIVLLSAALFPTSARAVDDGTTGFAGQRLDSRANGIDGYLGFAKGTSIPPLLAGDQKVIAFLRLEYPTSEGMTWVEIGLQQGVSGMGNVKFSSATAIHGFYEYDYCGDDYNNLNANNTEGYGIGDFGWVGLSTAFYIVWDGTSTTAKTCSSHDSDPKNPTLYHFLFYSGHLGGTPVGQGWMASSAGYPIASVEIKPIDLSPAIGFPMEYFGLDSDGQATPGYGMSLYNRATNGWNSWAKFPQTYDSPNPRTTYNGGFWMCWTNNRAQCEGH